MHLARLFLFALLSLLVSPANAGQANLTSAPVTTTLEASEPEAPAPEVRRERRSLLGRTGLISLLSSGGGSLVALLTLFLRGPQYLFLVGMALLIAGLILGVITLFREKGKPRTREWKLGLIATLVGGLPLLFIGLIFWGFYAQ